MDRGKTCTAQVLQKLVDRHFFSVLCIQGELRGKGI
jgi:hypothetical protein